MERIRLQLSILLLGASLALASGCGDYSGGGSSDDGNQSVVLGGGGLGGLSQTEQVAAFQATVYPLLAANCTGCHAGFGPGTPHVAHSDIAVAFSAVIDNQKVNFSLPESSRLVRRLATDFHYCWSSCTADGAEMLAAVNAWDQALEDAGVSGGGAGVNVAQLVSGSLLLSDGVEDQGGERSDANVIAKYDFKTGSGPTAFDISNVPPAMDLTLSAGTEWLSSYGLEFPEGERAISTAGDAMKLFNRIASPTSGSGEYTVEGWVVPGNTTQEGDSGPSRIISYARNNGNANFTVGQRLYQYVYRNRTVHEDVNNRGDPSLDTYDMDEDLQATLQHIVITFNRFDGRRIYVDGLWTDDADEQAAARLWNWDTNSRLTLGNAVAGDGNEWIGQVRFVAIHDRALSPAEVRQNYEAGVGKRVTLTFDISQWAGAGTVIDFSVTEFDQYSYLFCQPTIKGPNPAGLSVQNIRIQVNDTIPVEGQAFTNIDDVVLGSGHQISRQCSVIRSEFGPTLDQFTVAFEELGLFQSPIDPVIPQYVVSTVVLPDVPVAGFRDYARINATMAEITGVDPLTPMVDSTYQSLLQQLPSSLDIRSFVSSNQVGLSKLAFEYCHEMVEGDPGLRLAFFGNTGFEWTSDPATAFSTPAKLDLITEPLITKMLRHGTPAQELAEQPVSAMVETDLDTLVADLMVCTFTPCDADRTVNIVKGACTATLASAGVMVH